MSVSVEQRLHSFHAHTPAPPSPPPVDVDMSSSINTLGQRHDRHDADMQETNGHVDESTVPPGAPPVSAIAVEVAAVDEDAMDTTPDTTAIVTPTSPAADGEGVAADEPGIDQPLAAPLDAENAASIDPIDPIGPPPADPSLQPPPLPLPIETVRSDSESSDDDDGMQPWHPIQEDTSSPDEIELKEIEAMTEHSASDHDFWESRAFLPLEDPEYTAGETGRIEWTIDAYNGTREKPNRDIVMKSEPVTVGGHQWQIKFYPKGNDSDYLSVYVECLSVLDGRSRHENELSEDSSREEEASKDKDSVQDTMDASEISPADPAAPLTPVEYQHAPLPLLGPKQVPKRKCVAAQVSVVLYNPTEPRVNYSRTALHRFCSGSPDWGWTRFHGPTYDIAHRMRGQRQALLRDDKLAFTAYIRVVEDETNCLWEHHSRDNPWDSFAMTGLQSLILGEDASAPGGNMISAVASWMLFKPFRHLLYSINLPNPEEEPFVRPKPLLSAFQKVLYLLRTQVDPGAGPVALDEILDALEWYGIHERLDKLDVIEVWEVLRAKLEEELHQTPQVVDLQAMLGPKRDYTSGVPTYRVPVVGLGTMQEAVNKSTNFAVPNQDLPQLLTIELDRQAFDMKTRSYVKVLNKVTLDDQITVGNTSYTLYGFVVHKQTLQSYVYQPILRPEGPGSRWYSYSDSKDENQVRCLTKRQAVYDHEGKAGTERIVGNDPVAYIAMYIRNDKAEKAFVSNPETERWNVPEWVRAEVEKSKASNLSPMPPPPVEEPVGEDDKQDKTSNDVEEDEEPAKMLNFQVIDSRAFNQHEGPGIFDAHDPRWQSDRYIESIQLSSKSGCADICAKLAALRTDVTDHRQVTFWFLDPLRGTFGRPQLLGTGKVMYSRGIYDRYTETKAWALADMPSGCRRIWYHIIDLADIAGLSPKEDKKKTELNDAPPAPLSMEDVQVEGSSVEPGTPTQPPLPAVAPQADDTPMSEPEEPQEHVPVLVEPQEHQALQELQTPEVDVSGHLANTEANDTAMVEVETASVPDPPVVDVVFPDEIATDDTEMGGTQEDQPLPPPPPVDIPTELMQPPAPARAPSPPPPAEEIYFFLKFWNPETQALEARGSYIVLRSARVDETVVNLLGFPIEDKKKIEISEEEELATTRPIKHRRSFAQINLRDHSIIIVALPQSAEQRTALAARAAFADPQPYLEFRAFARNFPERLNGHFTYHYFSAQYYKGEIKNGHRHGHGNRIYHSGATYEGTFCLGQRHGHGLYTFQNGDTYDGDWVNNQQHGSGTFVEAATGNTYVGGWKNDKKFGEGVTHWKNAQEAERMCRICWEEPAEAAFYDCGHVVACLQCAREVQNCPVCRKRVLTAMKLYYVA